MSDDSASQCHTWMVVAVEALIVSSNPTPSSAKSIDLCDQVIESGIRRLHIVARSN